MREDREGDSYWCLKSMPGILLFWDTLQHKGPFHHCREKCPKPHRPAYTQCENMQYCPKNKKQNKNQVQSSLWNKHLTCGVAVVDPVILSPLMLMEPTTCSKMSFRPDKQQNIHIFVTGTVHNIH